MQLKKWTLEILFLISTVLICLIILLPIFLLHIPFSEFLIYNILFICFGITWLRLIIRLDLHPLAHSKLFKIILICTIPFLFFPFLEGLHSFIEFNDREGIQVLLVHLGIPSQNRMMQYIRIEYLAFGMMAMLGNFFIIIKMIRSIWRQYKYGII